jgi:hypothetical protein
MRSLGPAGWASHGFFGFRAKTFGNPSGSTSGDGRLVPGGGGSGATPWVAQTIALGTDTFGSNVASLGGAAILADSNGNLWRSTNGGVTWGLTGHSFPNAPLNIAAAASTFMVIDSEGNAYVSTDLGVTWTSGVSVGFAQGQGFQASNHLGQWVAMSVTSFSTAVSQDNGETWTVHTSPVSGNWDISVIWDGTQYVATGFSDNTDVAVIATAPDGFTWTFHNISPGSQLFNNTLVFENGNYMVPIFNNLTQSVRNAATAAGLATAADVPTGLPGSGGLQCVLAGNSLYWAFDGAGNAAGSTNGTTWSTTTLNFQVDDSPGTIFQTYDQVNRVFIAIGAFGTSISTHTDAHL